MRLEKNDLVSRSWTLCVPVRNPKVRCCGSLHDLRVQRLARLIFAVGRLIAPQFARDGFRTKAEWHWAALPAHGLSGSL